MAKHAPREPFARDGGFRGQRLEGLLCEELNSLLESEVSDPRLDGARVTRVELTRDGSSARVWFVAPNERDVSLAVRHAAFERAAGFLRSRLCDALPLKRSPELRFRYDPVAPHGSAPSASRSPLTPVDEKQ
ncbi:MAG TPA: 30S ribosome-binding factor RbfA [Polyangiaceae bacterium]|nr:30S ribosome-binding factor RbfA [Polyangiaceae bacterium]